MTDPKPPSGSRLAGGAAIEWAPGRGTYRIYHRGPYTFEAVQRRKWGPMSRFDHHAPADPPQEDPDDRSVVYVADALRTAVWEVLGRDGRPLRPGGPRVVEVCPERWVAHIEPRGGRVVLQDLITDAVGIAAPDDLGDGPWPRPLTQSWARAIYEDCPADIRVCGVHYWSAADRDGNGDRSGRNRVVWDTSPQLRVRQPGRGEAGTEEYRLQHATILPVVADVLAEQGVLVREITSDDCKACRKSADA